MADTVFTALPLSLMGNATKLEYRLMMALIFSSSPNSLHVSFSFITMRVPRPAVATALSGASSIVNVPDPSELHRCGFVPAPSPSAVVVRAAGTDSTVTDSATMNEL